MGDEMMSSTSCVTTTASPKSPCERFLNKYLIYALILAEVRAFQHSLVRIILRTPFSRRIFEMKVSMMMSVTTGSSVRFEEMLSSSKTMKRLSSKIQLPVGVQQVVVLAALIVRFSTFREVFGVEILLPHALLLQKPPVVDFDELVKGIERGTMERSVRSFER